MVRQLSEFIRIKHRLVNKRNQSRTIALANNLADVKVNDRFTADGHSLFLIYDKPGINRILVFCSLIGLIMLSLSNGTRMELSTRNQSILANTNYILKY